VTVNWKKTRDGSWATFGPINEVSVGTVTVTKKSGDTVTARVAKVSKPFQVDGRSYVFGYLDDTVRRHHGYRSGGYRSGGGSSSYYGRDDFGVGWNGRGKDPRRHDPGCTGPDSSCHVCFDD